MNDVTSRLDAEETAAMAAEADAFAAMAPVVAARRQHIRDAAPCKQCGTTQAFCHNDTTGDQEGPGSLCCWGGIGHGHVESKAMLDALMDEIMAGHVRTVAEAYPPPEQGPRRVSMHWLLYQDAWWYPKDRPAVRIASMDKPWKLNTVRMLERKADQIKMDEMWHLGDAPDEVWASFEHQPAAEFLAETPLHRALMRGLPTGGRKLRMLEARAVHWSTCPMRKAHPGALDRCRCERDGTGKVIGGPPSYRTA